MPVCATQASSRPGLTQFELIAACFVRAWYVIDERLRCHWTFEIDVHYRAYLHVRSIADKTMMSLERPDRVRCWRQ